MVSVLQQDPRRSGHADQGGLHGTNIVSVKALPEGNGAEHVDADTGHRPHEPCLPGRDRGLGRLAGDQHPGHADDPAAGQRPDREDATINFISAGETKAITFKNFPAPASADARGAEGRGAAGAGRDQDGQQLRRLPGHLLAALAAVSVSSATAAWIATGAAVAAGAGARWQRSGSLLRVRAAARRRRPCLLGDGKTDLVDFAVSLQGRIDDLHRAVDEIAAGLVRVDRRVDELGHEHVDRPLRRLRGHGRPSVGVAGDARLGTNAASSSRRSRAATTRGST